MLRPSQPQRVPFFIEHIDSTISSIVNSQSNSDFCSLDSLTLLLFVKLKAMRVSLEYNFW